jgi:PAS domain S-box-containing protein
MFLEMPHVRACSGPGYPTLCRKIAAIGFIIGFATIHGAMNSAAGADRKWNQRGNDLVPPDADNDLMRQLRSNQQLMTSIMDNITEAVYRTGPNHELIYANRAYLSLSGYESLEEIQRVPREGLYAKPDDRCRLLHLLATDGEFRNEEIEYISRYGKRWWGLSNSVAIRDPQTGALLYHVGSVKDISRRKATERELRDLNATLERRIEERTAELATSQALLLTDNQERQRREKIQQATFQISEAVHTTEDLDSLYRQVHAIVRSLMPANNFYISLHDPVKKVLTFPYIVDERDACPGPMTENSGLTGHVLRTGECFLASRANRIVKEDGRGVIYDSGCEVPFVECGTPPAQWLGAPMVIRGRTLGVLEVFDYQNEQAYGEEEKQLLTFIADQTALAIERKQAEQALRESEQNFRALFEASSAGVILHDEQQYLAVNPAILRIFGYRTPQDLLGKSPATTSPLTQPGGESSAVLAQRYMAECMTKGSARFDWVGRTAQGRDVPLEVILTRVEWGGKQLIQAVVNDISKRKEAEAELLRSLAREKELSALKSSFVSMVSHEFRTPLGIILSSAEILHDYFEQLPGEERQCQLDSIRRNTRRMADLMEEVLVLSRFDAGKMECKPAPLDVASLCRRIVDELLSATNNVCPIELKLVADLKEVHLDERLLRHILSNLISNAIKYSPPGNVVRLGVTRNGNDVILRVEDRGIGIPEEDRQWLFNAFHRARNVGERPGTGLGLVIVKRCIELHGGKIKVESKVNHGTTITVHLPC